ncbi:MAG: translation factor GTPase family protein [Actinomycetota bacterium]|nr:translation factor GTPase family protein [Actinomycetota bacterium]
MRTLNLGILAHVDAGKTSLTERLLHATGVIDTVGRVDNGTTQTDTLELERRRGITIRAAVASLPLVDPRSDEPVVVNIIDTPGHPDFIAEVERSLAVLDGAVLVVSAVEGVQAQTRVLWRALRRLRLPTLVFVNKLDRTGADYGTVVDRVAAALTPDIVPMGVARNEGTADVAFVAHGIDDPAFTATLVEVLSRHDDAVLAGFVHDDADLTGDRLISALAAQSRAALVHPVFGGSAARGVGIDAITAGIVGLLPISAPRPDGPPEGMVFKVERDPGGERVAYVRLFSGELRVRDRLRLPRDGDSPGQRVTALEVFAGGPAAPTPSMVAGQIGRVRGLTDVRIGDVFGEVADGRRPTARFDPPTLEAVVVPEDYRLMGALRVALDQLAEQDPLIGLRQDDVRRELSITLYGEVQKEVVRDTLRDDFGVRVRFRDTTSICVERVRGTGSAYEVIGTASNPFNATVGLRVEPAPDGSGVHFGLDVELGSLPSAFMTAIEETVHRTLAEGLSGWQVPDCRVTLTHSGYWPRQSRRGGTFDHRISSTATDFRDLTPLVLMTALRRAGTVVHEPVHRFRLDAPLDALGVLLATLAELRAAPEPASASGDRCTFEGTIPAAAVHRLRQRLPGLTGGEAVLETAFERYAPVTGPPPTRPRTDRNPLDRREYLLHVADRF